MASAKRYVRRARSLRPRWPVLAALILAVLIGFDAALPPDRDRAADRSTLVLDRQGKLLRAFTTADGTWRLPVTPKQVAPLYLRMLVAYEDRRFRYHPGVDALAVARAFGQWASNGRAVSGASTLTMQTVRLLEPRPRTLGAKVTEMVRALQLERRHSKDELLAMYLTLAPFGGNLEGVRAASLGWFGKEPGHLTAGEAALLVVLPQAPSRLRPDRFPAAARTARNKVIALMEKRGVLTSIQAAEARQEAIPTRRRPLPFQAPHLARRLKAESPKTQIYRTTIDGSLQATLGALLRAEQSSLAGRATIAVVVVENNTRRVRAYVGSSDFFNPRRAGQVDMVRAVRSPGSTLKPLIYGMAFDDRLIHPATIVLDTPTRFGDYQPENFMRVYRGEVSVREALQQSLNVPAVTVLEKVGPTRFAARLRKAGVTLRFQSSVAKPGLPVALGGAGVTLLDLVTLYTGLANGGAVAPLTVRPGPPGAADTTRIVSPVAAWYLARILSSAPLPEGLVAAQHTVRKRAIAFKTGTSYGFRDAWAVGFDGGYTVGVWVGRPDGTPSPGRYGRNTAAPVLFRVFDLLPTHAGSALARRPAGALVATNAQLPRNLRRLNGPHPLSNSLIQAHRKALTITFPPHGSVVELDSEPGETPILPLTAEGGRKPLRWIVNGRPVQGSRYRRQATWTPDGVGFVRVMVIDADGRTASADARVK